MGQGHPLLRVSNVKGFAEPVELPLAPITLLFGWNSAGKSTLLQTLLLLKQTLEDGDPAIPSLVVNGSLTQHGSFRNLVHRHDPDATVEIGVYAGDAPWTGHVPVAGPRHIPGGVRLFAREGGMSQSAISGGEWSLRYGDKVCRVPFSLATAGRTDGRPDRSRLTVTGGEPTRAQLLEWLGYLRDHGFEDSTWRSFLGDHLRVGRGPMRKDQFEAVTDQQMVDGLAALKFSDLPLGRRRDRVGHSGIAFAPDAFDLLRETNTPEVTDEYLREYMIAQLLGSALYRADSVARDLTGRLTYLGPFRQPPERLILLSGERFADVGVAGENTIALLGRSQHLRKRVDDWLARLKIPYELAISQLDNTRDMLGDALVAGLREADTGTAVGMRDVGFGISQVLPVVVQAVAGNQALLAVEQPELHLHPRLQAELGELFAEQATQGSRFLIETHSEHLILRLLSLVRSGRLRPEDLAVVYVDRSEDSTSILKRMRVDEEGEFLDSWPHGFFTERRAELGL